MARRGERTAGCGREEQVMAGLPPAQIDPQPAAGQRRSMPRFA